MTQYSNSRKQRSESPGTPTLVGGSRPSLRSSCLCGKNQPAIHHRDTKSAERPSEIEKDRIMTGQNHNGDQHSVLMILSYHDSVCLPAEAWAEGCESLRKPGKGWESLKVFSRANLDRLNR